MNGKNFLVGMALLGTIASFPVLGAVSFWDSGLRKSHKVSDLYPLPVREGLTGKGVTNLTLETCNTDGSIPLNELDTFTAWLSDDGGSFTDDTTDANDAGTGDTTVFPATPAEDDAVYIGNVDAARGSGGGITGQFNGVKIDIGTQGSTSMTVTWEYYSKDADWATLTFVRQDVADFDEAAGVHWNTFVPPSDWIPTAVNGQTAYWIRARVSAFTSTSTSAVVDQAWVTDLTTDTAKQIIIRTDSDETEDIWCKPLADADGLDADADEGFVIDAGTGALTVEVSESAGEWICCGDGGASDVAIVRLSDGS